MKGPGFPTLDQLRVFLAVVETGSFTAAGRRLKRATSAVSYSIAGLERQLVLPSSTVSAPKNPRSPKPGLPSCPRPRRWLSALTI